LPGNPRIGDVDAVAASLEKFGQRKPIVVRKDDGTIIAGNHTWQAAKKLGWKEIAVAYVGDDDTTAQAYALADNRTAELGSYDEQALKDLIDKVAAVDPDLVRTSGWSDDAVKELVERIEAALPNELNEDVTPELPTVIKTKLGDIYQLGCHRLMCGDSTDEATVLTLMDGAKADMVFTDPPYGMNLDTDYTKMGDGGKKHDKVIADNQRFNAQPLLQMFNYCNEIFLWGADYYVETLNRQYPDLGSWIIWDKYSDAERKGLLDGRFGSSFETCWSKAKHKREIARILVTTNYTARGDEIRIHPTQKPVALAQWFFERWAKNCINIVDLYLGSGSTLIACEKLNKVCYGMELDPKYCDIIIKRWENLTGEKAVLTNAKSA
ncbi:MAG: ParB N-terminal domain-containing protein, partial [Cyanobacteria bacterium REEB494]|nr:ParB N-terminal domain-containing protein [Cyanobacteria bacterium REEB494]